MNVLLKIKTDLVNLNSYFSTLRLRKHANFITYLQLPERLFRNSHKMTYTSVFYNL